jgi:hypothetical protein
LHRISIAQTNITATAVTQTTEAATSFSQTDTTARHKHRHGIHRNLDHSTDVAPNPTATFDHITESQPTTDPADADPGPDLVADPEFESEPDVIVDVDPAPEVAEPGPTPDLATGSATDLERGSHH